MMQMSSPVLNGRYVPQKVLGTGTYGQVLRCTDTFTGKQVAVKVAQRDAAYRRSAMNEIHALQLLSQNDDSLNMLDFFEDRGHLCIVSELLQKSFYDVLQSSGFQPLPLDAVRVSGERVLRALAELHKVGYMHSDIKPENVMLRPSGADCRGKDDYTKTCLIDFGAVRQFHENTYYDIQSLWYRAPEVLLGVPYTPLIDSWSVGCLLFELYTGKPLFPGESQQEQIDIIANTLGFPSIDAMTHGVKASMLQLPVVGRNVSTEVNLRHLIVKYRSNHASAGMSCYSASEEAVFIDFLSRLLEPDVTWRVSCRDALRHPFFAAHHTRRADVSVVGQLELASGGSNSQRIGGCALGCSVPFDFKDKCRAEDFDHTAQQGERKRRPRQRLSTISNCCGTLPLVAVVRDPPGVVIPMQAHSTIQNVPVASPEVFLPGIVYQNPRATIVQPVQFHVQQQQPLPPPPPPLPPTTTQQQQQQHIVNTQMFPLMASSPLQLHLHPAPMALSHHERTRGTTMISSPHHNSPQMVPMSQFDQEVYSVSAAPGSERDLLLYKIYLSGQPSAVVYAPT